MPEEQVEEPVGIEKPPEKPAPEPPKITSAAVWKRKAKAIYTIELPSKAIIKAVRPKFGELFKRKIIDAEEIMAAQGNSIADQVEKILPVARKLMAYTVVAPKVLLELPVGREMDENEILADDIPEDDCLLLFAWVVNQTSNARVIASSED